MQTLLHLTEVKEYIEYGDATPGLGLASSPKGEAN
jgi:hypothetical protein